MKKLICILGIIALAACSDNDDVYNKKRYEANEYCRALYALTKKNITPEKSFDDIYAYCECYSRFYTKIVVGMEDIKFEEKMKLAKQIFEIQQTKDYEIILEKRKNEKDFLNTFIAHDWTLTACGTLINPSSPETTQKYQSILDGKPKNYN